MKRAAFLIALLCTVTVPAAPSAAQDLRPNILWIVLDDGNRRSFEALTQAKAAVADQGVVIDNFVMTTPACAPSRASMLRGQYSHNHGVLTNGQGYPVFRNSGAERDTVATRLQHSGYHTIYVGKYLNLWGKLEKNAIPDQAPGWTIWASSVVRNESPTAWFEYRLWEGKKLTVFGPDDDPATSYEPTVVTNRTLRSLKTAPVDKPFFAVVNMRAPHMPATPHPDFANAPVPQFQPSPSYDEPPANPAWHVRFPALTNEEKAFIEARNANRYRSMLYVDRAIVKILNELQRSGRLANTYVFVLSDNGMQEGEHRLARKGVAYEESLVAPMWVRGPRVIPGRVDTRLAATHDLAPTALRLANQQVPNYMDGRDLRPLLYAQRKAPWRTAVLGEVLRR